MLIQKRQELVEWLLEKKYPLEFLKKKSDLEIEILYLSEVQNEIKEENKLLKLKSHLVGGVINGN